MSTESIGETNDRRFDSERRTRRRRRGVIQRGHDTKFTVTWPVAWQRCMDQRAERFDAPLPQRCYFSRVLTMFVSYLFLSYIYIPVAKRGNACNIARNFNCHN